VPGEPYSFGTRLAVRCDYFAFPRTGSHFFWACLTGLLDLVYFPNEFVQNVEAMQRADELNPHAFYALRLRQDDVPYQPVYVDASPRGLHAVPAQGAWPCIVLIRNPHAAIYSWYHTAIDRWGAQVADRPSWIRDAYRQYRTFYEAAFAMRTAAPDRVLLVRFEHLKAQVQTLTDVVNFLGVRPKLSPEFVHWWTAFDRWTRPGPRTFYRGGDDDRWREDAEWRRDLVRARPCQTEPFGYPSI
jgi:hypothetical protein